MVERWKEYTYNKKMKEREREREREKTRRDRYFCGCEGMEVNDGDNIFVEFALEFLPIRNRTQIIPNMHLNACVSACERMLNSVKINAFTKERDF